MKTINQLWIGLGVLIAVSPLGLLLPEKFKAGSAWGEWGPEEVGELVGYVPQGLVKLAGFWNAPIPDYAFKGWEEKPLFNLSLAYIFSALTGILLCVGVIFILGRILTKKE